MNIKFNKTGILLCKQHPVIGASPDAISDDYVVEIKCPTSKKSASRYLTRDDQITAKYNAQLQLQMYIAKKIKDYFV